MFIVIGIGLAAGIQYGSVAILASVAFNVVVLVVWRMNWGAEAAVLSGFRLVHPAREEPSPGAKPHARLRLHTTQIKAAEQAAVALLPAYAKRWRQVRTVEEKDGTAIVEFDLRLKKSADPAAFTAALEESAQGHTGKVELERSMDRGQPG